MEQLVHLAFLMLPIHAANMAAPFARPSPALRPPFARLLPGFCPAFARLLPGTPRPVSERWQGSHKTWRGCTLALLSTTWAQARLQWQGSLIGYEHPLPLGLLCGSAAMAGDSAKSFVKRRLGIAPGRPWVPADQLDYVVAGLLALSSRYAFQAWEVVAILAPSFIGALAVNRRAARWGIKQTPW